jgi:integrase
LDQYRVEDGQPLDFHTWRGKVSGRRKKSGEKTPHGVWYRALRATAVRPRGPYHTRHTFISVGLSNGVNPKWLAEYCGTSLAMIERHYGRYVNSDVDEQLARLLGTKTETFSETLSDAQPKYVKRLVGPPGLEPGTNRL